MTLLRPLPAATLLAIATVLLPLNVWAQNTSEQIETGRARVVEGKEIIYRIRLLPPASFPALPAVIAAQLDQKKCMIPQTYEARGPENVVHGAFERKGSDDWAALCSVNGATTLYVFFQSRPGAPVVLRHQRDAEWLGAEVAGAYGSAWGIALRRPSQIQAVQGRRPGLDRKDIDHDGIEDAFIDKSSTVHYFHGDSWIHVESAD